MITALHTLVYADDPVAARAFLRDVLGWPFVDAGEGWLIFKSGPSEMGVHPTSGQRDGAFVRVPEHHEIALMCDDIETTVAGLREKGAEFLGAVEHAGFGLTARLKVPGAGEMLLYEPRHALAHELQQSAD